MKLAVLFDHFGPYHLARLRGASAYAETLGVEFYGRSQDYAWEVADRKDVRLTTLVEGGKGERLTTPQLGAALDAVLTPFRPDVVAVPGWSGRGALAALQWCLHERVPAVLMSESSRHDERRQGWKEWIKRRLVALFPAALVGGSSHAAYLEELGMPRERVFLGYDAIDNDYFSQKTLKIQAEATKEARSPHFLASARFIEKKNLFRLLRAYADYRNTARSQGCEVWRLELLGDGELRAPLEALIKELQLTEAVTLLGFKQYDELPGHYARASAFIHASTTEQWGLVVNEAMACGLPVLVSSRCGCAPDLVQEGVNGHAFDPCDLAAISSAMLRLTKLPEDELKRLGQASREIIAQWGSSRFGDGLICAARKALAQKPTEVSWVDTGLLSLLSRQ